ncbi:MAG: DUF2225 domain-containing protein [Clostridiales bacterium]|nr:DUF2225 domain-containing protein [Clostridiales bacterium]
MAEQAFEMAFKSAEEIVGACTVEKSYDCGVCETSFKARVSRSTKLRFSSTDADLHPNFNPMDPMLYDVIICPHCGYASMTMYWNKLTELQIKSLNEIFEISKNPPMFGKVVGFREAMEKYKRALLSSVVKGAKHSEQGYVCLKLAWLNRLVNNNRGYILFISKALRHLEKAYTQENFPICTMDEPTLGYLLAYCNYYLYHYDEALRWLGKILPTAELPQRLRDKALDLKESIKAHQAEESAGKGDIDKQLMDEFEKVKGSERDMIDEIIL